MFPIQIFLMIGSISSSFIHSNQKQTASNRLLTEIFIFQYAICSFNLSINIIFVKSYHIYESDSIFVFIFYVRCRCIINSYETLFNEQSLTITSISRFITLHQTVDLKWALKRFINDIFNNRVHEMQQKVPFIILFIRHRINNQIT